MAGLSDSVTVGILLLLVFGAAAFYLYSRMTQNEKRLSLLESLLLTLKISTEASLNGPDMVEAMSNPVPLESHDVDSVNEEEYADMLKSVSAAHGAATHGAAAHGAATHGAAVHGSATHAAHATHAATESPLPLRSQPLNPEEEAENLLRSMEVPKTEMNVNYESMTVKELQGLAKERGLPSMTRKKELVEALKKGGAPPAAHMPLIPAADELEGSEKVEGFMVNLDD